MVYGNQEIISIADCEVKMRSRSWELFNTPLSDETKISQRILVIRYFQNQEIGFPFEEEWFDIFEYYLSNWMSIMLSDKEIRKRKEIAIVADTVKFIKIK